MHQIFFRVPRAIHLWDHSLGLWKFHLISDSLLPSYVSHHKSLIQTRTHLLSEPLTWQAGEGLLNLLCQCLVSSTLQVKPWMPCLLQMLLQGCCNPFTGLLQGFLNGRCTVSVSSHESKFSVCITVTGAGVEAEFLVNWNASSQGVCAILSGVWDFSRLLGFFLPRCLFTLFFLTFRC